MDGWLKKVQAKVGDVAGAVGDLLLDSDSEGEDEAGGVGDGVSRPRASAASTSARAATSSPRRAEISSARDEIPDDDDDDSGSEYGDEPLIPDAVWGALRAAKDRVAEAAKTTVESVSRDVAKAAESVRRDLAEPAAPEDDPPSPPSREREALLPSSSPPPGAAARRSSSSSSPPPPHHSPTLSDADSTDAVAEAFERGADALETVGAKVEAFGFKAWAGAGKLLDAVADAVAGDDADEEVDGISAAAGPAAPPSFASRFAADRDAARESRLAGAPTAMAATAAGSNAAEDASGGLDSFERRVHAMQRDGGTYCDEPEDAEAYASFCRAFDVDSDATDATIAATLESDAFMRTMAERIVPAVVPRDAFWTRYFFRLTALETAHGKTPTVALNNPEKGGGFESDPRAGDDADESEEKRVEEEEEEEEEEKSEEKEGDEDEDEDEDPARRHIRRVSSLATDEEMLGSDADSVREAGWTAVRSDAGLGARDEEAPAEAAKAAEAEAEEAEAGTSSRAAACEEAGVSSAAAASAGAPAVGDEEDDLDEDWGMDSD
jgi:hypothetical protein